MKSPKIPMTFDEFELMEWKFGWKHEYWDGYARISPRHNGVLVKVPVENRQVKTVAEIQPASEALFNELVETFYAAFVDSPEYCNRSPADVKKSAKKNIKLFFDGGRGIPQLELSRVAFVAHQKPKIAGAVLVSKYKYGYKDEILFVRPKFQRKGIGTALVASVLNALAAMSEQIFWSEYQICNSQSAAWHKKFGFIEEPDLMIAKLRFSYLKHEISRHEKTGNHKKVDELKPLLQETEAELERLEETCEKEGFDKAYLMWRNDY